MPDQSPLDRFRAALNKGDAVEVRALLESSAELREKINAPIGHFGSRAVNMAAKHPAVMDVLLDFGADINLRSDWEKGPFSVLDAAPEEAVRYYLTRGAILTAHAAARLGWTDELRKLVDADPAVVHEKGGDGQRPLHFAKTPAVVDFLLDRGADIDARCDDHHSTAAQYALVERPEIARHLIDRGATPDIFMPARLGDIALADRLIDADPSCLSARINGSGYDLVVPFNIYCWSLGWYLSPHEVALKFKQQSTYEHLLKRSSPKVKLLVACSQADEAAVWRLIGEHPDLLKDLTPADHALMPYSLFYRRVDAVKLMLSLGFDPLARGTDGGTLLHVAAWTGQADIVETLLRDHRDRLDLEARDTSHNGTPLGWAIHGSKHAGREGDHLAAAEQLIAAGAKLPEKIWEASDAIRSFLHRLGVPDA